MPPVQLSTELEEEEDFEEEEEEEEIVSPRPQYTSPLASKISGSYSSNYGSSPIIGGHLSSSLTRRSLDSVRDRSYTGLRKSSASSAPPAKKGMSLIMNLLIILVLGFIAWMVYINFEAAGRRPSLTTSS